MTEAPQRRLIVCAGGRPGGVLGEPLTRGLAVDDPTLEELLALVGERAGWWLTGGEPTLRADLPALLRAIPGPVGLETDGLALTKPSAIRPLLDAGLAAVRVRLHAVRADAQDWLVGRPGATKGAIRALRALREAGLRVELSAMVTRPTLPHLVELVALACELGLARLNLHRLPAWGGGDEVMLLPPPSLLAAPIEAAVGEAKSLPVALHGFPRCLVGELASRRVAEELVAPSGWLIPQEPRVAGCGDCPGPQQGAAPGCAGVPAGYLARFGRAAFPAGSSSVAAVRVRFGEASTRALRQTLVRAAQHATTLRIADATSLLHPEAAEMLREAGRLFATVEVAGLVDGLGAMDDGQLYLLRGLTRVDGALLGPDAASHDAAVGRPGAFEATLSGLARLSELAGVETSLYGIAEDEAAREAFRRAWAGLPGEPRFVEEGDAGRSFDDRLHPDEPASEVDRFARGGVSGGRSGADRPR